MAKFKTNTSSAIWWPNLKPMQVAPSGGQILNQSKLRHLVLTEINLKWFWLKKISQVMDSIPWVRCASGNVSRICPMSMRSVNQWHFATLAVLAEHKHILPLLSSCWLPRPKLPLSDQSTQTNKRTFAFQVGWVKTYEWIRDGDNGMSENGMSENGMSENGMRKGLCSWIGNAKL